MRSGALLVVLCLLPVASAGGGADPHAAKDPANFTWVDPGVLAVGGGGLNETQVDWLHEAGFRAIADVRIEHQDPEAYILDKGMAFFDMPIDSASHINETMLLSFIAFVEEQKAAGRPVYVHCTNGWHRAAALSVAWRMASTGASFDEAARQQVSARPGTVMRATSALLDLEATLTNRSQLAVVLVSNVTRPEYNATMPAHVDVFADGAPAAGASVRVWSEESKLKIEGVTDENGRLTFEYKAPKQGTFMDHVYARASLDGFADGADNIEFLFGEPAKARGPLDVSAARVDGDLVVEVTSNGKPTPARVIVTAPGWTGFESSAAGRVRFPDAPTDAITVRAVAWGAEQGVAQVDAIAPPPVTPGEPAPGEPPVVQPSGAPPVQEPPAQEPPVASPPVSAEPEPEAPAPRSRTALVAVGALVALGAVLYLGSRRRTPS